MTLTTTQTFCLSISAGGIDDELVEFEVEVTGEITPSEPERGPTYSSGGEPASDGYAEVTDIAYIETRRVWVGNFFGGFPDKKTIRHDASWLMGVLPKPVIEGWAVRLYEDYEPEYDERRDRSLAGEG